MAARVRVENSRSRPRSSVTLATMATRIAGAAAMMENRPTMRTCRRAPARPERRAAMICQTSRAMMPSSSSTVTALASSSVTTTPWVGASGVRSARTMKVRNADSSARMTVSAPKMRVSPRFAGGPDSAVSAVGCSTLMNPGRFISAGVAPVLASRRTKSLPRRAAFIQQCCRNATIQGRFPKSWGIADVSGPGYLRGGMWTRASVAGLSDPVPRAVSGSTGRRSGSTRPFGRWDS